MSEERTENNAYRKFMLSTSHRYKTRQAAIKAMCAHCMGCTVDHLEPGYRKMVRECVSYGCPLHIYRPKEWLGEDDGDTDTKQQAGDTVQSIPVAEE